MFFSEKYGLSQDIINEIGFANISLTCDTPLYIDPLLIYMNDNEEIKSWYQDIVKYLLFLNSIASEFNGNVNMQYLKYYFCFKEIKENWLGTSKHGNVGLALGIDFAKELSACISNICNKNDISKTIHVEKMFLINKGVGKDKISDMVTNILQYRLLKYTEQIAKVNIDSRYCDTFFVKHCRFDYDRKMFVDEMMYLPYCINKKGKKEYIILTPISILRLDEQEINYCNMIKSISYVCEAISNENLRFQVNKIIDDTINELYEARRITKDKVTDKEIADAKEKGMILAIGKYPELYDYFIKITEEAENDVKDKASKEVKQVEALTYGNAIARRDVFGIQVKRESKTAKDECLARINFFKSELEVNNLWKNLYYCGKPISQESDLQRLFRLCWYNSLYRLSPETNSGNGPVDFQVSNGFKDTCNIEFKLASNTRLKHVYGQVAAYQKSQRVDFTYVVIFYFDEREQTKACNVKNMNKDEHINVVLINCIDSNKVSPSNL